MGPVPPCSSVCQVQGDSDLAKYFRPLPDGYWAVPPIGRDGILPQVPACLVAKKYVVGSTQIIYLILEKCRREQAQA
jgi:hypothetical protein